MKAPLFLGVLSMSLLLSACQSQTPAPTSEPMPTKMPSEMEEMVMKKNLMPFTQEAYEAKLGQEKMALFFHASWCPTCLGMEKEIMSATLSPESLIFQVDYDNSADLQKKYKVTSQSSVVILDSKGEWVETLAAPSAEAIEMALAKAS